MQSNPVGLGHPNLLPSAHTCVFGILTLATLRSAYGHWHTHAQVGLRLVGCLAALALLHAGQKPNHRSQKSS